MAQRQARRTTESEERTPLILSPKDSLTITHSELEEWRWDNEWILAGYRRNLPSYRQCIASLFYWHNESVNIWTHLVGSAVALAAFSYVATRVVSSVSVADARVGWWAPFNLVNPFPSPSQPTVTLRDTAGFAIFFLSAATCLGFSASFHTFTAHSREVSLAWNRMDYIGIVVLITGTFIPCIRFGFYCNSTLQTFYLSMISLAGAGTIAVVLHPNSRTPAYRRFRTWVFIALGLSAVFPMGHAVVRYGWRAASDAVAAPWAALGGALYIFGALLYAERFPERLSPGKYDYVGASHQLFHVAILLAATSHYCCLAESFRFWHGEMNGVCSDPYAY